MAQQRMGLGLTMKTQLRMTQQLQQAIKLLQLSRLELIDTIQEELTDNPALEEMNEGESVADYSGEDSEYAGEGSEYAGEGSEYAGEGGEYAGEGGEYAGEGGEYAGSEANYSGMETPGYDYAESAPAGSDISVQDLDRVPSRDDSVDWEAYLNEYQTHTPTGEGGGSYGEDEMPNYEATLTVPPSLYDHLLRQVKLSRFDEVQEQIACDIIGNIDEDGYLVGITLEEIAAKYGVDLDSVVYVQETIQEFDPTGVGSRDLKECLLSQAEILYPDNTMVREIISNHLGLLERKNYDAIARALKTTPDRVRRAAKVIVSLNPRPGVKYNDVRPQYVVPDVYVDRDAEGEFHVSVNDDGMPRLRVSPYYSDLIRSGANEAAAYIRDKMASAKWFLRSIQQRERTIFRVTEAIVARQRDFFEKGVQYLKPMVLKDIADDTDLSESTISRVTNQKYVHTPQGTFELKYFFTSKISRMDAFSGDDVASKAVQDRIRQIISTENPQKPYSDQKIVEILKEENIDIARRTVAKYREALGILSSSQRKNI